MLIAEAVPASGCPNYCIYFIFGVLDERFFCWVEQNWYIWVLANMLFGFTRWGGRLAI